ncbi:hypothetical protein [Sulfurimonas sp.]|uniref:hypothetical protein n=1 Tax=Sulfurimonas sp. TaxID=2022749 RepID=UPI0035623CC0
MAKEELTEAEKTIELMKQRERLLRTNKVEIAGVVMEVNALPQAPKTDKGGQPILENGQPTFYDEMFWCSIGVVGSEEGVLLSAEQAINVQSGFTYLFAGKMKNRKFKVATITEI